MEHFKPLGLVWTKKDATARSVLPTLAYQGRRIWELLAQFSNNQAQQIVCSFYNRGDAGEISAEAFDQLIAALENSLTEWAGKQTLPAREIRGAANTRSYNRIWVRPPTQAMLEWSSSRVRAEGNRSVFRAEYIRLRLTPAEATKTREQIITAYDLRERIRRADNGDIFLPNLPMVDQGQKGYCAAAVMERIMRYYNIDFDQHQFAQIAGSAAKGGTSRDNLTEAARRIANWSKMNFRILQDLDVKNFLRLLEDYNRAAKSAKQKEITHGQTIDLASIYKQMDAARLKTIRTERAVDMRRFAAQVEENINLGVPLLWSVMLGVVKEQPALPQADGGHMRIIIGYNRQTSEILYSDSWGSGHELKRMPTADAWTITTGLFTVTPRNIK